MYLTEVTPPLVSMVAGFEELHFWQGVIFHKAIFGVGFRVAREQEVLVALGKENADGIIVLLGETALGESAIQS